MSAGSWTRGEKLAAAGAVIGLLSLPPAYVAVQRDGQDISGSTGSAGRSPAGASSGETPAQGNPPLLLYPEKTLSFQLYGCDRDDDLDLDVPEHPDLESKAEVDFESCFQGGVYVVGKNGAVISDAAPSNADATQCQQAVEEEPEEYRIPLEPGQVVCVMHYDDSGTMRVFRLVARQVAVGSDATIVLTATGWR